MENKTENNYLEINALKVVQPLGSFYIISISADKLIEICFSEPLKYVDNSGKVQGSQRVKDTKRLKEIATYIESVEMAFPNSIIVSANYNENGVIVTSEHERWKVIEESADGLCKIIVPKKQKLAAIIDGQHRLSAFEFVKDKTRLSEIQLVCSVYFDLPNSYQAFLFATINSNQKKVDRSLALEQFGYNVDDESEKAWTPEKLAVFLSRKLNTDKDKSPLYKHIKVAPLNINKLFAEPFTNEWVISTATIVDGITGLISSNPKRDRILMQHKSFLGGRSREMVSEIKDASPLRHLFLSYKDQTIYDVVISYFKAVEELFWHNVAENSYIYKTVGVQALFDVLKSILRKNQNENPLNIDFRTYLFNARNIDFSDKFFQSSGIGRGRIRNSINVMIGLLEKEKIKKIDLPFYELIFENKKTDTNKEKWLWEEEAENEVINVLQNAIWNYDSKTVSLFFDEGYETLIDCENYEQLYSKLIEIAESTFVNYLPSDPEFADEQKEKFNPENLVESLLVEYEPNLEKINWKK